MMEKSKCINKSILLFVSMIMLLMFGVSAENIVFVSPTNGDTLKYTAKINVTLGENSSVVQNVSITLSNNEDTHNLYSTSSSTYLSASDSFVSYTLDTTLYANGNYALSADMVYQTGTDVIVLVAASESINVTISNTEEISCEDYTTKDNCIDNDACRWDSWRSTCFQANCWDFWNQEACSDASDLGLACNWNTGGSSGWCEDAQACWNYKTNSSCTNAPGSSCTWSGSAYCQEINCWNYNTKDTCRNHSANGCTWDGWSCKENSSCYDKYNSNDCTALSDCMWRVNEYCAEEGCWNYNTEDSCNSADGCSWKQDSWSNYGWCEELGACWSLTTEASCESADCFWQTGGDDYHPSDVSGGMGGNSSGWCMFKDCYMYSGTSESQCEDNAEGLNCAWQAQCQSSGPGGSNCWGLNEGTCLTTAGCSWGNCMEQGCWDYTNQTSCEAASADLNCYWSGYYCQEQGCWDSKSAESCNAVDGCTWMNNSGWCTDESCSNYNTEASCLGSELECAWQNDSYGGTGWCYELGCWNYNNQTSCELHAGQNCAWNSDWNYCYEEGCWSYMNESSCTVSSSCEWATSGWCSEIGCWSYNSQSTCNSHSGEGCSWQGSGWCSSPGCWNYKTKTDCGNQSASGCKWNDEYSYCYEQNCYDFTTNATCVQYPDLNCTWNGWSCNKLGCWNFNNDTSCNDNSAIGCAWQSMETCKEKSCWNYKSNQTCIADTECQWSAYCTGDYNLSCWNNYNEVNCLSAGCKWEGSCSEKGCWSYSSRSECCGSVSCTENSECGWQQSGWCQDKGCWNYMNQTSCTNDTRCAWNTDWNYCYERGCWEYNNSATCEQKASLGCKWNSQWNYCYEGGCWEYSSKSLCQTNNATCLWSDSGSYCYDIGCWNYGSESTCGADTDCEWKDSGWCYTLGCWNYGTQATCINQSTCSWNSQWNYCYEKGCWDYTNESSCNSTAKCRWNAGGNYCYERGCWDYTNNETCLADTNCFWDNSSTNGWCKEQGCWDYMNESACNDHADDDCLWNSQWNYCYEKGCWEYSNDTSCLAENCYWDQGSGGWCQQEGCWDNWDEASCEADSCTWDSTYEYCYEQGCWQYEETNECNDNSNGKCAWRTSTWGWCQKLDCFSYYGNQSACENPSDSIDCMWNDPYCEEVSCAAYDGLGEEACENNDRSLECNYTSAYGLCEPLGGFCSDFDGKMKDCMDTKYCIYDYVTTDCVEPQGVDTFAQENLDFNPGCWIFDANQTSCGNVNICVYNVATSTTLGGSCEYAPGFENQAVQCENITEMGLCNSLPALSTCCKWRNGQCTTDFKADSCRKNLKEPPVGAKFCEDDKAYDSSKLCLQIANHPWYMPCNWTGKNCEIKIDDIIGTSGDYSKIKNENLCEKANGEWKCDYYCDDKGTTADNADDELKTECWCVQGTSSSCKKSCWACEYQNDGTAWENVENASNACEKTGPNCEFTENATAPNGFGFCDFKESSTGSSCDSSCAACNDEVDLAETAKSETKIACLESTADCKWSQNLANKSQGTCIDKKEKTCSEDCFKCSESECDQYGLGTAGSCDWNSDESYCKPTKMTNQEICSNGKKDDDNDGTADCEDMDCFFSSDCSEGVSIHECWKYNNQSLCQTSPVLAGSSINCSWIQPPFGGQFCGHPSEACWQYNQNQSACNNQQGACEFKTKGGMCDIKKSYAESCFGKAKSACTGNCSWIDDAGNKATGGRCEFAMFSICHASNITSSSACTSGTNGQYCSWIMDPMSGGGKCEPKCFGLTNNNSCETNSMCTWMSGACEPNITTSEDCYTFDNTNATTCEASGACMWQGARFGGEECEPEFEGIYVNGTTSMCGALFTEEECSANDLCLWMNDPMSGSGFCEFKAFMCMEVGFRAIMAQQSPDAACNAASNVGCVWSPTEPSPMGVGACIHTCANITPGGPTCSEKPGCKAFTGFCDPKGAREMFQTMDSPPIMLAEDDCGEASIASDVADICGMGIKDDFNVFGVGIGVRSMLYAAACNGEYVMNYSAYPPTMSQGSGSDSFKVEFYLDTNGQSTDGCNTSVNSNKGFEYKIVLSSTTASTDSISKYKCTNSEWKDSAIKASTLANIMCGEANGPIIMIDRPSIIAAGDFDKTKQMRIYVLSLNISLSNSSALIDSIIANYTPGVVDFKLEDCMGFVDSDGDGLVPDQDPDCKMFKKFGGIKMEDCSNNKDDDENGYTDCEDMKCKPMPICGGSLSNFSTENDTTSASVESYDVTSFVDSAVIKYYPSEPANGTLLFYNNDSSCLSVQATVYDIGITDSNIPMYRLSLEGKLSDNTLGAALDNGTTYYYKIKVCDKAGNPCGTSACLNFTTEVDMDSCGIKCQPVFDVKYSPPEGDSELSDTEIQWDFGDGYAAEPCGGLGGFKKAYNETDNIGVKLENDNADNPWSLEFENASITGDVDTNDTSLGEDDIIANETDDGLKYVGMDHDAWEDFKDAMNPQYITICVPGNVNKLYNCPNVSEVSIDDCTDVTEYTVGNYSYNSELDCTEFTIPADLGFSVYFGVRSTSLLPGASSGGGGGAATKKCDSVWVCTDWSRCVNSRQTRTCVDRNLCLPATKEPPETEMRCTLNSKPATDQASAQNDVSNDGSDSQQNPITGNAVSDITSLSEDSEGEGLGIGSIAIIAAIVIVLGMLVSTVMRAYTRPPETG